MIEKDLWEIISQLRQRVEELEAELDHSESMVELITERDQLKKRIAALKKDLKWVQNDLADEEKAHRALGADANKYVQRITDLENENKGKDIEIAHLTRERNTLHGRLHRKEKADEDIVNQLHKQIAALEAERSAQNVIQRGHNEYTKRLRKALEAAEKKFQDIINYNPGISLLGVPATMRKIAREGKAIINHALQAEKKGNEDDGLEDSSHSDLSSNKLDHI